MAPRPRIRKRSNFPDNMYEPREGYYTWRDPRDGKTHILGRMPLAQAIYEAQEANAVLVASVNKRSLADRLTRTESTVADLVKKMPTEGLSVHTVGNQIRLDKVITQAFGTMQCSELTTRDVAELIEEIKARGKMKWAQMVRSRLVSLFKRANSLGWVEHNPASNTEWVKARVTRTRLSFEQFQAIYEQASKVNEWLPRAMLLALVSGQDRSTISRWRKDSLSGDVVDIQRGKTRVWIRIPVALRLEKISLSLGDVIADCMHTGVASEYLIHRIKPYGDLHAGDAISPELFTKYFAEARSLAKITGENLPSFHEIRSLSKRLYNEQGGVDTKSLLGHKTEAMSNLYADHRGSAPIIVKI